MPKRRLRRSAAEQVRFHKGRFAKAMASLRDMEERLQVVKAEVDQLKTEHLQTVAQQHAIIQGLTDEVISLRKALAAEKSRHIVRVSTDKIHRLSRGE